MCFVRMNSEANWDPPWLLIITWQDIKLTPKSSSAPETPYKQQPLGLRLPPQEIPRLYCPGGGAARLTRYSRHNPATRQLDNRKGVNNNSTHQSKNIQNNYRLKNFLLTANLKKDMAECKKPEWLVKKGIKMV